MELEIKNGNIYVCIKNYKMENGEIAYTKGKKYFSKVDGYLTDNSIDVFHKMNINSKFAKHFLLIQK
jgi:hypothetical protein